MPPRSSAYIVGAFEHPTRKAPDKSVAQLHAECAQRRAGRRRPERDDVDGYFCAGDAPGIGAAVHGGIPRPEAAPRRFHRDRRLVLPVHVGACGRGDRGRQCNVALITLAGRPRARRHGTGAAPRSTTARRTRLREPLRRRRPSNLYAMVRARHMHEFGTTPRAARLGQGRGVAPCAAQPARHAARGGHGRGRAEFADGRRPAAPARLLRGQRRRRRADRRRGPRSRKSARSARWSRCSAPARRSRHTRAASIDLTYSGGRVVGPARPSPRPA